MQSKCDIVLLLLLVLRPLESWLVTAVIPLNTAFLLPRQVVQFLPQLRNLDILCGDLLIPLDIAFLLLFIEGLIASSAGLFLDGFPILSPPLCRNNFPGFRIDLADQRALAAHLLLLRVPYPFLLLVNICHPYSFAFSTND